MYLGSEDKCMNDRDSTLIVVYIRLRSESCILKYPLKILKSLVVLKKTAWHCTGSMFGNVKNLKNISDENTER